MSVPAVPRCVIARCVIGLCILVVCTSQTVAAEQPQAKEAQPNKTDKPDEERIVGNWIITNDDSKLKGEVWVIDEDRILMYPMHGGLNANLYLHRLDAGKDPKQIDITVTKVNGPRIGIIKGLYALDGDELRLCLAALGKDRPAAFPKKPAPGEFLILRRATSGALPPKAKEAQPGKTDEPAKTDQERIIGNWIITNDDSQRKREMWVIYEDRILMYAKHGGANAYLYFHRLDAGKDPKQIDITVTKVKGSPSSPVGIIKGIYVLDGDELRLCLAALGKNRPAAFPKKPGPGEVLILHRDFPGASPPKAKEAQFAAKKEPDVLTPDEAIQQRDKETITVQFTVASAEMTSHFGGSDLFANSEIELTDGKGFSVLLRRPVRDQIIRLGIKPTKHFSGKVFRVTGQVQPVLQPDIGKGPYWIVVDDLKQFEVVRDRTGTP